MFPRNKGFIATVQNLRASHVSAVYDVTIAYARGDEFMIPPTFFDTLYYPNLRRQYRMYAFVKRHDLESLPKDNASIAQWLEDRWMEKGEHLQKLQDRLKNGQSWRESWVNPQVKVA